MKNRNFDFNKNGIASAREAWYGVAMDTDKYSKVTINKKSIKNLKIKKHTDNNTRVSACFLYTSNQLEETG